MVLNEIIHFNEKFVKEEKYKQFQTTKFPNKKIVILSCMDTRLTNLLPAALNLKNGDAKIIKNAGAVVSHPYGSVMRSILIAIYNLGINEILVIGHTDCGMKSLNKESMIDKMLERGINEKTINEVNDSEINLDNWFQGMCNLNDSIKNTVSTIEKHPLIPEGIKVYPLTIDSETGKLTLIS